MDGRVFEEEHLIRNDPGRARRNYQGVGRVSTTANYVQVLDGNNEVSGVEEIDPFLQFKRGSTPYWLRYDNDVHVAKHRRLIALQQRSFREYGRSVGRDNILCNEKPKGEAPFYLLDEKT